MSDLAAIAAAALPAAIEAGETEFAKGLAGLLGQVYGDTVSPGAKQVGLLIEDVVKTVRLLAWPLQMGAVFQDRFRRDLTAAMEKVPESDRQIPPLKLFADCCEGSKFEDDPTLHEMWLQLLSRGCDKTRVGEAHPAFPGLLRQLSSDEAKLIEALAPLYPIDPPDDQLIPKLNTTDMEIEFPEKLSFYMGHIGTLGMLCQPSGYDIPGYKVIIDEVSTYILSDFGHSFISALNSKSENSHTPQS